MIWIVTEDLTLEAHEQQEARHPRPTNSAELSSVIDAGDSVVLYGTGGIGKTTFLLELGTSCLSSGQRIPLFVDAAAWGCTVVGLFEYLAGRPSAQGNGVTSDALINLAEAGRLVILLNGWNEMSASSKLTCREELIHLTVAAAALNVVVTSRTSADAPALSDAKKVEVRGLTWHGQAAVIRAELSEDRVLPLLDLLAKDSCPHQS